MILCSERRSGLYVATVNYSDIRNPRFLLTPLIAEGIRHQLTLHNKLCLNIILVFLTCHLTCQPLFLSECKEFRRSSCHL